MLDIKTKTTTCFCVLSLLFILSCAKHITPLPYISEETQIKKILQEQGRSVVYIGMYNKKGDPLSYGSGFFISQDGMIAANYHVIAQGYGAIIKTLDGKTYEDVYLLSYDQEKDIALLRVNEMNATCVKIGNSDLVKQGDKAVTVGNPEGFQNTVSDGIISGILIQEGMSIFQISCSITHRNSGGPLYNLNGEVIGITTSKFNFAVPINYLKQLQQDQKELSLKQRYLEDQKKLLAEYLEKQKTSSKLDPEDALFEEAYEFYQRAVETSEYPDNFTSWGTNDPKGIKLLEQAIEVNPYYHAAHYVLGKSYRNIKEYEKAEQSFLKCITLKPKCQATYTSLAGLYVLTKRHDDALKLYVKALDVDPSITWIYSSIGDIYLERNNFDKAKEYYRRILDFDKSYVYAYEKLGNLYLKKGNLKTSWDNLRKSYPYFTEELEDRISSYRKYLEKNNFYAYASVGRIYYYSSKYDKAVEYLEKAYGLNPNEFDQYYELGMAHNEKRNYQKAAIYLEKAVAMYPNHYDANLQLGILYDIDPAWTEFYEKQYKIKPDYDRAIELLKRAKQINPGNTSPYYYLGSVYYHTQRYYDALKETKKALNIKEDSSTFSQLGNIYFAMNEYENALVAYKKSLAKGDFQWTRSNITKTLFELKKYDEAIAFLREGLEKYKDDLQLKRFLGDAYRYKNDYETAIRKYKDCLRSEPKDFLAHFEIASCYGGQENWIEAKNWWEKAAEINPKSSASFANIGIAYFSMESYDTAKTYFEKALDINPEDNKTKEWIKYCQSAIDRKNFPEKLRRLSYREDNAGILARLLLCIFEYNKATNLWAGGAGETKRKYEKSGGKEILVGHDVSSKIYEAQGRFEKIKGDLSKMLPTKGKIKEAINLFSFASEKMISGIEQHSKGYYIKAKDYRGEYEKGLAKIDLAHSYFLDVLRIIQAEIVKHITLFGNIADQDLKSYIKHYEKMNR